MEQSKAVLVNGKAGLRGQLASPLRAGQSDEQVQVRLDDGRQVIVPGELLVRQTDGSYYLPLSLTEVEQRYSLDSQQRDQEQLVLPVITEELEVHKRTVTSGGVRIKKLVSEREEVVDEPLLRDEVNVERVPVNQYLNEAASVRYEGDVMIIPVLEEVLVVEKRLLLKEELRVTRRQVTKSQPQTVTLRSEEVQVERLNPQSEWQANDKTSSAQL